MKILIVIIIICIIYKLYIFIYKKFGKKPNPIYLTIFFIIIIIGFLVHNECELKQLKYYFEELSAVHIFIKDDASNEQIEELEKELEKMPYFKEVNFVPEENVYYEEINYTHHIPSKFSTKCYYIYNIHKFDEYTYFKEIENVLKKYDIIENISSSGVMLLYNHGGLKEIKNYIKKVEKIENKK